MASEIIAWLTVAALAAATVLFCRWLDPRPLLPPQRVRAVPWSGPEALLAVVIVLLVPGLVRGAIGLPGHSEGELWGVVLAAPVQAALVLFCLYRLSGTRPYQLGVTCRRFLPNARLGCLAWLLVTPSVLVLHGLVSYVHAELFPGEPEVHPLERYARAGLTPAEWGLLAVTALAAAPALEELLFRGVLQPWFICRSQGGVAALIGSAVFALLSRPRLEEALRRQDISAIIIELLPLAFVLALVPLYALAPLLVRRWLPRAEVARGLLGTALLFAVSHAFVWPTPVPLFVLGLALGWLAWRTQSLVAPFVLHSLFNAVATLALVLTHAGEPTKGNEATTAARVPPGVTTSTAVPGS
ncbi:MAG: CPBP family intramembrane metalloprotease [Gemmataceae bacterium]|nr:CPBP family intramembrane metalloprotease [Gemmataceae bacterium]MDW8264454.1 CPBP family intramembrane glutamic endopeptidase [Gemmataceae bacterium]